MGRLVNELGFSPFWGRQAVVLAEYTGPEAMTRYKRLVADLGVHGTEFIRDRDIAGYLTQARVVRAEHSIVFPCQEDAILQGTELDAASDRFVRFERKEAYVDSASIEANVGVVFTAEPPRLQVYNLMGRGVLPQAVELAVTQHALSKA